MHVPFFNATLLILLLSSPVRAATAETRPTEFVQLRQGLELWLPMRDGFRDYSKNHLVGEVNGHLRQEKEGAYFDGEGDCIIFPGFDFKNKDFAISMWTRVTGNFGNYGILQQKSANRKGEWLHLVLREQMQPMFSFYVINTWGKTRFRKKDGWRHLLVQYADGKCEIHVNGKLDASSSKPPFFGKGGKFIIGLTPKWSNVPSRDFEGYLSDFRVYSRSLTRNEIRHLASLHGSAK